MRRIRTQTKGVKPLNMNGGNELSIYTFLTGESGEADTLYPDKGVVYQVRAHFEQNVHQPCLKNDWIEGKHFAIAKRMLERGGRQDIFLGTRECQGYAVPRKFGEGKGAYDDVDEIAFGLMFHGFDYPDEAGGDHLVKRFWIPVMKKGVVEFPRPEECPQNLRQVVRPMTPKIFGKDMVKPVDVEAAEVEA
jgi:CRISPR-associated protein Cas5d